MPEGAKNTSEEIKLAIVGGRDFTDYQKMCNSLTDIEDQVSLVISGGRREDGKGADTLAIRWAEEKGKTWIEFLPDWDKHGKAAGPIRNEFIVKACTHLAAFWDGKSCGTADVLRRAKNHKKRYRIVNY